MGTVSEYLSTLEGADHAALERVYAIASELVPDAQEGTSYGMPALIYRGKGLIAAMRTKKFFSIYPFSGAVVTVNHDVLGDFETTSGSIHFSLDHQLPEDAVRRIVKARLAEIDTKNS